MKKLIFAIAVLAIILTAGILESVYVHNVFTQLDDRLYIMEDFIKEESPDALEKTRELKEWWEKKRKNLEIIAFSPDIRAFSVALGEAEGSLECSDYDNALSKVQSLIIMSSNIHHILDFNIEDIV